MSKDYYKTLGVEKNATADEIKKAFRKIAHKHHPDKPTGDEAKFKEANEAYQVLSDQKKRAQYDQFGSAGPGAGGGQGFGGFDTGSWSGTGFSGFQQGGQGFDFGDIDLGDLFGGGFGGGRRGRSRRGQDLQMQITIDFVDAVFGVKKKVSVTHTQTCHDCSGSGAKTGSDLTTCSECNGQGKVQQRMMGIFATVAECPTCEGSGQVPKDKCSHCRGAGVTREKEEIEFTIPAGIKTGDNMRISGKGEAVKKGQSGDLYLQVQVKPHKDYSRKGLDLYIDHTIKISEAVSGTTHTITTLNKKELEIKIPAATTHGTKLRVAGAGIKTERSFGDLYIIISIEIPKKLSKKAKEAIGILSKEGY